MVVFRVQDLGFRVQGLEFRIWVFSHSIRAHNLHCPKGARTQIIGLQGPYAIDIIVFGP